MRIRNGIVQIFIRHLHFFYFLYRYPVFLAQVVGRPGRRGRMEINVDTIFSRDEAALHVTLAKSLSLRQQ